VDIFLSPRACPDKPGTRSDPSAARYCAGRRSHRTCDRHPGLRAGSCRISTAVQGRPAQSISGRSVRRPTPLAGRRSPGGGGVRSAFAGTGRPPPRPWGGRFAGVTTGGSTARALGPVVGHARTPVCSAMLPAADAADDGVEPRPRQSLRPHRLAVQDIALSRRRRGFESRWGHGNTTEQQSSLVSW
jgi:hypothetical protein